ncbi:hypothetical protein PI125_g21775 [Phytophthora idaei]|nr:hypothetical protein PI125_g21775 [Phytophthora idaei]
MRDKFRSTNNLSEGSNCTNLVYWYTDIALVPLTAAQPTTLDQAPRHCLRRALLRIFGGTGGTFIGMFKGQYGYATSNMMTRSLAMYLRESNIVVVTIYPETSMISIQKTLACSTLCTSLPPFPALLASYLS